MTSVLEPIYEEPNMSDQKQEFRRFECHNAGSHKFWEIWKHNRFIVTGGEYHCYTTRWGKIGTNGTIKSREYSSTTLRNKEYSEIISKNIRKGYTECTQKTEYPVVEELGDIVILNHLSQPVIKDPKRPLTVQDLEVLHVNGVKQDLVVEATVGLAVLLEENGWHWGEGQKPTQYYFPPPEGMFYGLFPLNKSMIGWEKEPTGDLMSPECNRVKVTIIPRVESKELRQQLDNLRAQLEKKKREETRKKVERSDPLYARLDSLELDDD